MLLKNPLSISIDNGFFRVNNVDSFTSEGDK